MKEVKLTVGGSLEDDAAAILDAWHRTRRGEKVRERSVALESWEELAGVLTGERYRLLRHLHAHPEPSVSSLARLAVSIVVFMPTLKPLRSLVCLHEFKALCGRRQTP